MPDLTPYMNLIIPAALVLAGLLVILLLYKLLRPSVRGRKGSRIGISEYHEIDKTRRLVLVRRDDVEHLVMIGGGQDVVIENNIGSPLTHVQQSVAQNGPTLHGQPVPAQPFRAPRPPVFASRRPELRSVNNEDETN
jgi:Flagellar biosynthesis protein, FliO